MKRSKDTVKEDSRKAVAAANEKYGGRKTAQKKARKGKA
jgi:hypothetical protein